MKFFGRLLLICAAVSVLPACSIFEKKDEELKPTELLDFKQTLPVKRIWSAKAGKGTEFLRLALMPAGDGARIYAASYDGQITAFDLETGRQQWRVRVDGELTSGPGTGGDVVVVAGRQGEVFCLRAADGSEVWRTDIEGESVSPPLIHNGIVVIATIDGKLRGLSTFDGAERWSVEEQLPPLTLRGSAAPIIVGTTVIKGFDNGRLVAVDLDDGVTEWESMLSPPSGRSDLERLSDVDGTIAAVGQDVYAVGYHGRLAALAAESGQILWAREISSYAGIGADWEMLYTTTEDGELLGLQRRNGTELWRQSALIRREPTAPVAFNTTVAVGDFEGYVHFFNNADGTPVARVRVGKGSISGAPVVIGGRLYVQNESGDIAAFKVPQPERPEPAPAAGDASSGDN